MHRVAVISVTLNAVLPMMAGFAAEPGAWSVTNYLDEGLQARIAAEGGVRDGSISRMAGLIGHAVSGGAEAILLTCTVFSPHLPALRRLFATPLIGADVAMLEQAAKLGRRTAILCTFPASLETSRAMFAAAAERLGQPCDVDVLLVEGALQAAAASQPERHDALIAEAIRHHASDHGAVVLAQMSMARAAALVPDAPVPVFTSPACAVAALAALLGPETAPRG